MRGLVALVVASTMINVAIALGTLAATGTARFGWYSWASVGFCLGILFERATAGVRWPHERTRS